MKNTKRKIKNLSGLNEDANYIVKQQEAEARITDIFAKAMREISYLKSSVTMPHYYNREEGNEEGMKYKAMVKKKLYEIAMKKMNLLGEIIQETLGEKKAKSDDEEMEY